MVGLLAAVVVFLADRREELGDLRRVSIQVLLASLSIQFLVQLVFNASMLLPLKAYTSDLGFWEFYLVRSGGFVAGSLVPLAGNIAVRLAYLRRRGLTVLEFTWATLLSNALALVAAAVLTVAVAGALWIVESSPQPVLIGLSAGMLGVSLAVLVGLRLMPRLAAYMDVGRWRWLSAITLLTAARRTIVEVFALSLIRHGLNFVTFGLLYRSLSQRPDDFLTGGLVYVITSPVRMVTITPGNVGVNEWVVAVAGTVLTLDVATGLIVAFLFRGLAVVAQGCGLVVGWVSLSLGSRS